MPLDNTTAIETVEPVSTPPSGGSRLADLFHRVNSVIPEAQELVTVAPSTTAGEALALLAQHRFSQVPVVRGGEVLGSFSYRSFARGAVELHPQVHGALEEVPAEEFMEALDIAHATEELASIFDALDRDDAVLVGAPNDLQAVVTPMDALRYLYRLTEPYVQLGEIERSLRMVVDASVADGPLAECARRALQRGAGDDCSGTQLGARQAARNPAGGGHQWLIRPSPSRSAPSSRTSWRSSWRQAPRATSCCSPRLGPGRPLRRWLLLPRSSGSRRPGCCTSRRIESRPNNSLRHDRRAANWYIFPKPGCASTTVTPMAHRAGGLPGCSPRSTRMRWLILVFLMIRRPP